MMSFYFIDDDKNICNILKLIINERGLGVCCGSANNAAEALEDLPSAKPDIVIVDLLMPEMDGISFVKQARKIVPDASYIMLSQVSSKDMIASDGLSMKRMVRKMQNIFMEDTSPATVTVPDNSEQIENSLRTILTRIGIIGDIGSKDIISIVKYLVDHQDNADSLTVSDLCSHFCDTPKSMEQRIRRTAFNGLVNLAHLGLEDYSNEIFVDYSSTLYNFEQVRTEMDFIRGKTDKHGNVRIKQFLNALASYCQ